MFDFSILGNIDFTNKDNLLFLFIFLVAAIIVFLICLFILVKIIKAIDKLFKKAFNINGEKPEFDRRENKDGLHHAQNNRDQFDENPNIPKLKVMGGMSFGGGEIKSKEEQNGAKGTAEESYKEKEQKGILEHLNKLKANRGEEKETLESKMPSREEVQEDDHQKIKIPRAKRFKEEISKEQIAVTTEQKTVATNFTRNFNAGEKKELEKNSQQKYDEKEQKDIAAGLEKLKGVNQQTSEEQQGAIKKISLGSTIKIPKPKHLDDDGKVIISSDLHGQKLVYEKEKIEAAKKTLREPNKVFIESALGVEGNNTKVSVVGKGVSKDQDGSIFGSGLGISRRALRHDMIVDPEIKKAARITKLGLSPAERAGLVKEVFSPRLGQYISEKDMNKGIKKLNRKLRSTDRASDTHRQLRKEIKFFKKIGGIK